MVIMTLLYPIVQMPPAFGSFTVDMYFHAIGISIAVLAACLVISIFNLDKYEPPIDFPIHYRGLVAMVFGAIAAIIFAVPALNDALPDVAMILLVIALVFLLDVGGAVFIEMLELPRKLNKTFSKSNYFTLMIPSSKADWGSYKKMGVTWWLTVVAIGATLVAGLIGFMNLWAMIFGASFFQGWINMIGYGDVGGFLDATLDPHSHMMALAIMAGTVAIVAEHFKENELTDWKRIVVKIGLWISFIGVIAMTLILAYCAFGNYNPFTLFPNGPSGIAGDDSMMAIIGIGALIALVPLGLTKFNKSESWRDSVRVSILGAWLAAIFLNIFQGFWIEMNETAFQGSMLANDDVFSTLQPMYGIFFLTATTLFLLAADYYQVTDSFRRVIGWVGGIGIIISMVGAFLLVFVDPSFTSAGYYIWVGGIIITVISAILAFIFIVSTKAGLYKRTVPESTTVTKDTIEPLARGD